MMANATWDKKDGLLMVDYSAQQPRAIKGKHVDTIDALKFEEFLSSAQSLDFDIILEIKDKEKSAIKAMDVLRNLREKIRS